MYLLPLSSGITVYCFWSRLRRYLEDFASCGLPFPMSDRRLITQPYSIVNPFVKGTRVFTATDYLLCRFIVKRITLSSHQKGNKVRGVHRPGSSSAIGLDKRGWRETHVEGKNAYATPASSSSWSIIEARAVAQSFPASHQRHLLKRVI